MGHFLNRVAERVTLRGSLLFLMAISVVIRFMNIGRLLLGRAEFRQTQTALTVREWLENGVIVFDYITPVFGPGTCITFEFPIYQLSCYFLYKCLPFLPSLDMACILANLGWFFLSAYMLYRILLKLFPEKCEIAFYGLAVYMISPYTIYWSHTCMIDYCSVFFSLAYANFFVEWLRERVWKSYLLLLLFGSFAYLSKVTTVVAVVPFITFFILKYLCKEKDTIKAVLKLLIQDYKWFFALLVAIFIPLGTGVTWSHYSDLTKIASGYVGFTSNALVTWNFGTFQQRVDPECWFNIFYNIFKYILPYAWGLILIFFIAVKYKILNIRYWLLVICAFLPIIVFFNLYYRHDYYFIAVSPFICAFAGACFYEMTQHLNGKSWIIRYLICISVIISIALPRTYWDSYFTTREKYMESEEWKVISYVNEKSGRDDSILILGNDWSSSLQYYIERSAATMPENNEIKFPDVSFGWIVCGKDDSIWLAKYPNRKFEKQIGKWKIYQIVR